MNSVGVWKTNKDEEKLSKIDNSKGYSGEQTLEKYNIEIIPDNEFQEIIGFGGAFNEIGWEALTALNEEGRNLVMEELFDKSGCNFTLSRTPIGASDFALEAYSLNDIKDDFEMNNFSIERDKNHLIPYIKEAIKKNPNMKVWSCPWSPPYWMKSNSDMCNGGELIDSKENLAAYAKYFAKYIEAYKNEGIDIFGFCVQNETDVINIYPTSTMTPELMTYFLRAYLIPEMVKLEKKPLKTEIWVGTIRNVKGYVDGIVSDPVIKQFVKGIGYQYSSADTVGDSYKKHPGIKLLHTEAPCHNGANSWKEAENIFKDIVMYLENGCTNYCYWNMVLNETGLSTWNWKQNSMITVNRETKEVIFNPEFYVMKHFSHFIMPGAKRIESQGDYNESYIAFKNPDGSIICVLSNFSEESKIVNIIVGEEAVTQEAAPGCIYTIKIVI